MFIYTIMSIDKILADFYGGILIVLASIGLFIYYKLNKAQLIAMKGVKINAKKNVK